MLQNHVAAKQKSSVGSLLRRGSRVVYKFFILFVQAWNEPYSLTILENHSAKWLQRANAILRTIHATCKKQTHGSPQVSQGYSNKGKCAPRDDFMARRPKRIWEHALYSTAATFSRIIFRNR